MKPEEENPNHFRNIALEMLQSRINLVYEGTINNKEAYVEIIIQNFLEEFKGNELINLKTVEEVKRELKKLKDGHGEER